MNIYDFTVETRTGEKLSLSDFKGKVLLIVNTATGCGFTPQYEALENLYQKYHHQGFEILDFPCNQFGHQAPGSDEEIHDFCTTKYQTTFDQLKKIDVNGPTAHPLFNYLKTNAPEDYIHGIKNIMAMKGITKISKSYEKPEDIKWNFTKFLIDSEGHIVKRLSPIENPLILEEDIKKLLN